MRAPWILTALVLGSIACAPAPPPPVPATAPAPGALTLPPRPRDIPIDDIDPCTLLTPQQRAELSLEGEPLGTRGLTQLLGPSRDCTSVGFGTPNISIDIALAGTVGIDRYTGGGLRSEISALDVEGFPAVLARPTNSTNFCTVAIDIAPGQLIDVQFGDGGANPSPVAQDDLCDGARRTATAVMRTLLAR